MFRYSDAFDAFISLCFYLPLYDVDFALHCNTKCAVYNKFEIWTLNKYYNWWINIYVYIYVTVICFLSVCFFLLPTGRICRRQLCRYFVYSRAGFGVFRLAGATRCTDQGQIWQRGANRRFAPSCQISPWSVQGWEFTAPKLKKIGILPI